MRCSPSCNPAPPDDRYAPHRRSRHRHSGPVAHAPVRGGFLESPAHGRRAPPSRRSPRIVPRARGAGAASAGASARCSPQSIKRRAGAPQWGFYEGPPTANGDPGTHHVLSRVFKDIFPRYRTMTGHYVERKGGWDCHGLAVELAVEAELGMKSKDDIERYGIAEFNARCREKVLSHVEEWNRLTERIGFWIDLDDAYRTLDPDYVESVWWALKTINDKGLLYEKLKVVPYCPRDQVTLSSHELGQPDVYQDVHRPVGLRPSAGHRGPAEARAAGDELLVWTTTPWTLVSNAAVAVDPELTYVRARTGGEDPFRSSPRRWSSGSSVDDAAVLEPLPGPRPGRRSVRAAVRLHPRQRVRAQGPHGPAGRLRHRRRTAPGSCTPRSRSARMTFASASSRASTCQPGQARRHLRRADRPLRRALGQGRRPRSDRGPRDTATGCCAPRPTSTPTPTAGAAARRCCTTPSRPGTSPPARSRTGCWPPTRPSTGTPSTSSTGASGTGSRATSTGRCRASATGARRCRCGAARRAASG